MLKVFKTSDYYSISILYKGYIYKIFQISFGKDGSIYANFPYYKYNDGILSICTFPARNRTTSTINLIPGGKVTLNQIKYSHHASGLAHFSKAGYLKPIVSKQSIALNQASGHIFTVQFQGIDDFRKVIDDGKPFTRRKKRYNAILKFSIEEKKDEAFKILGYWYSLDKLESRINDKVEGPGVSFEKNGKRYSGFLIAPPSGNILENHVLSVLIEELPMIDKKNYSTLTFLGGFDPPEIVNDISKDTNFLAFIYPAEDYQKLLNDIGSVDLDIL